MSDPNKELFLDLNFRTALLESVGWDESQSASLLLYLENALKECKSSPKNILDYIRSEYSESAYSLIKEMFFDEYIEHGLYTKTGSDYEH